MHILTKLTRALVAGSMLTLGSSGLLLAATGSGGGSGTPSGGGGTTSNGSGSDVEMVGEILLKLKTTAALQPLLAKYPLTLVDRFGARPIYRVKVTGTARVKDLLPLLALEPDVMIAEPNITHRSPEARKNAPWTIGSQAAYMAQWAPQAMHLGAAQALSSGAGIRVAVIDTGVDRNHPLLAGRLLPGFDFVDFDDDPSEAGTVANAGFGHGTHVAGLVAMVAPGALILPVRALDADGVGNAWVLAEALLYAVDPDGDPSTDDGAQVINLSLGSLSRTRLLDSIAGIVACTTAVDDDPVADRSDPGYGDDVRRCANNHGVVVVAASGNDASGNEKQYPAAEGSYGLMAIAATSSNGKLASFSNFGSWIDMAAPGEGLTSAIPGGGYATWSGTSMASPLVAGTVALLRAREPALTPPDLIKRVKTASTMLCGTQMRQIDAAAALNNVLPTSIRCP